MLRILSIEDSEESIEVLKSALHGLDLTFAKSIKESICTLEAQAFSVILLDLDLPDGSGLEIFSELREKDKNISIICITGKKDFASKISAFALGADDFIQKPFDPRELRIRVEAKLRKYILNNAEEGRVRVGDLTYSVQEQRVTRALDGSAIDLTGHEFRIFRLLAKMPSKVFTREEILERVWSDSVSVTDRTVDVHISNLRRKIGKSLVSIETVIGVGYRLSVARSAEFI